MSYATDRGNRALTYAWAVLLGSSALYFLSSNDADNDLWGQLLFGRAILAAGGVVRQDPYSYTALGAPWVDHEWLSQVLFQSAYAALGGPGLLVLKIAVGLVTFVLLLGCVRSYSRSPWVWGSVTLLVLTVLSRGFAVRPQIFTYLGFAALLFLLNDRGRRLGSSQGRCTRGPSLWIVPMMALWVNLHGGFVLGLGTLALYTAAVWGCASGAERRRSAIVLGAAILVSGLNPYGWRLLPYIAHELTFGHPITEWQPVGIVPAQITFGLLLGLFILTLPFARCRERPWQTVLALAAALLAIRQQRHTPVFALASAGLVAAQLDYAMAWWRQQRPIQLSRGADNLVAGGLITLAVCQLALQGGGLLRDRFQIVFDPGDYPVAAVRFLSTSETPALNLAVPLDWGEYVLWHLAPRVKVSLDGRFATVFPPRVVRDNFAFFAGDKDWARLLTTYPTDAALVPRESPCPVRHHPGWRLAYADTVAALYVRSDRADTIRGSAAPTDASTGVFP